MLLLPIPAELRKAQVQKSSYFRVSVRKPGRCPCSSMAGKIHPESKFPTWNVVGLHSRVSLDEERSPSRAGVGPGQVLHLFRGFSAALQASIQNALQCVTDCWFMLRDCFRFASQGKSCYIKMIQDFAQKTSWIKSKKYYCNCVS